MPSEKATALVLRVVDFGVTSCVVTLFSREFGKVRALAKGGRRPKGPFEAALDLLATCRIVFLRKSADALDLLTEAKLLRRFRPFGRDLLSLYAGYYVAELVQEWTDDSDPHPPLFDLCQETLEGLASGGPLTELVSHFELVAMSILGHQPALECCAECGIHVAGTRVPFALLDGGVLCAACRRGKRKVISVSAPVIDTLAKLASMDDWKTTRVPPEQRGELRAVLQHSVAHLAGRKPRMHEYLGSGDWGAGD